MSCARKIIMIVSSVILVVWAGCGGGGSPPPTLPQSGKAEFYLTDQSGLPYTAVWLKIQEIDVHSPSSGWKPILTFNPPVEVDALKLRNLRLFLGMASLPQGVYDGIRFVLSEVRVVENGAVRFISVPDTATISASFQIRPDGVQEITVDINVE
ncbi:MAG: DUF4382 domain-containing protein, partial [bacterium]